MSSRYLRLNRLPTLQEVLDRRTRPPLDLFCFYVSASSWTPSSARVDPILTRDTLGRSSYSENRRKTRWTFGSMSNSTRTCARRTSK